MTDGEAGSGKGSGSAGRGGAGRRGMIAAILFAAVGAALALAAALQWFGLPGGDRGIARVGGPFALEATDGRVATDKDFAGKAMLIYFGFTFCPDACPTALARMAAALDILGADGEGVQPLLVTLDPERDTAQVMRDYVALFHPRLIGLRGTPEQTAAVAKAYRVYFEKTAPDANGDYLVNHTDAIFLMGPDGRYLTLFGPDVDPQAMAEAIRYEVK